MNRLLMALPLVLCACFPVEEVPKTESDETEQPVEEPDPVYTGYFSVGLKVNVTAGDIPDSAKSLVTISSLRVYEADPAGSIDYSSSVELTTNIGNGQSADFYQEYNHCFGDYIGIGVNNDMSEWLEIGCEAVTFCEAEYDIKWSSPNKEYYAAFKKSLTCGDPVPL